MEMAIKLVGILLIALGIYFIIYSAIHEFETHEMYQKVRFFSAGVFTIVLGIALLLGEF